MHRLPVRAGALHGDVSDGFLGEPADEGEQLARCGPEGPNCAQRLCSGSGNEPTRHDGALVDIEPGAAGMDDLHGTPPDDDGREGAHPNRECLACSSTDRGRQSVMPASARVEVRVGLIAPT